MYYDVNVLLQRIANNDRVYVNGYLHNDFDHAIIVGDWRVLCALDKYRRDNGLVQ